MLLVALLVEDRDLGYLFLDVENAPAEAHRYQLSLEEGIGWDDVTDEEKTVWMEKPGDLLVVVPRETVDFEKEPFTERWPIPTPEIVFDDAEYQRRLAE